MINLGGPRKRLWRLVWKNWAECQAFAGGMNDKRQAAALKVMLNRHRLLLEKLDNQFQARKTLAE